MTSEPRSPFDTANRTSLPAERKARDRGPQLLKITILCTVCTILNLYISNAAVEPKISTFHDVAKLRRPNPFVGLDRVNLLNRSSLPLLIYPGILSQINREEPARVYGDDPIKFSTLDSTEPPTDRKFRVTDKVSTIVEFRAVDYAMENCELLVTTPVTAPESTLHLGSGTNLINIWTLKKTYPIDMKMLSWDTRPSRIRKIDTIALSHGSNYTYRFPCPLNSLHTFEFSAAHESTYVKWSQSHKDPNPAVVVQQYASNTVTISDSIRPTSWGHIGAHLFDSFPALSWSIPVLEHVAMRIIASSSHYEMGAPGWDNLLPPSGHIIHLSHSDGTVGTHTVAMFHQLRCLEMLHNAYLDEGSHRNSLPVRHCLNYLRQTILCHMDLRNEPQSSTPTHNGADALCYDWEPIYKEAAKNFEAYSKFVA